MSTFMQFLAHEQSTIEHHIAQLEQRVEENARKNPRTDGFSEMLEIQKRHQAMLSRLVSDHMDADVALAACYEVLLAAQDVHGQIAQQGIHAEDERWWMTLDVVEFTSTLILHIEEWKGHHTAP